MNSEVRMLLEHRQNQDGQEDMELSDVFQKTLDYCKVTIFSIYLFIFIFFFSYFFIKRFSEIQQIQESSNNCKCTNNVDAETTS